MIVIGAGDILKIVTSSANEVHYVVNYVDTYANQVIANRAKGVITAATSTTVLAYDDEILTRVVTNIQIRNNSGGYNTVEVNLTDDDTIAHYTSPKAVLGSGEYIGYSDGWRVFTADGEIKVTAPTVEVTGGGGGTDLTPVIHNTDTDIVATKNTAIYIPPSTFTGTHTIDISDLDTDGDRLEIYNHDSGGFLYFIGGTQVYLYESLIDVDASPILTGSIKIYRIDSKNVT